MSTQAARARVQGGATWREYNRETQLTVSPAPAAWSRSTGVAGLTLGGGLGWLMGKYGMAVDNLRAVELVTADSRVLRASADEHPDLFWARPRRRRQLRRRVVVRVRGACRWARW